MSEQQEAQVAELDTPVGMRAILDFCAANVDTLAKFLTAEQAIEPSPHLHIVRDGASLECTVEIPPEAFSWVLQPGEVSAIGLRCISLLYAVCGESVSSVKRFIEPNNSKRRASLAMVICEGRPYPSIAVNLDFDSEFAASAWESYANGEPKNS